MKNQWLNFGPRVGVAWDVSGTGRTALRASYGLALRLPGSGNVVETRLAARPYSNRLQPVESRPGGFDDPYGGIAGGKPRSR
jgi:hypothetical protein